MILDGHIHTKVIDKMDDTLFMILGSTVTTQFDKKEASHSKGFHKMTFEEGQKPQIEFVPIESNRKFFYYEVSSENSEEMRNEIDKVLGDIVSNDFKKKPIVKIKITGKDNDLIDHDIAVMNKKYSEKTILTFVKQLESAEITEKLEFMKNLRDQKLSVEEIGLNLLKNNLDELKFDSSFRFDQMFSMMINNEIDKALGIITGDQKVLHEYQGGNR